MPVSTEDATTPKCTKSRDSNSSVQIIQIKPNFRFEVVLRHTAESGFPGLADVGGVPFLVEIVICVFFDVRCLLQTCDRSLT